MDKFIEIRRAYQILQSKYSAGKLGKATFQQEVEKLAVQDQYGNTWQIGVASGNWYRFDGSAWIEDLPPIPPAAIDATFVDFSSARSTGKSPKKIVKRRPPQVSSQPKHAPWYIIIESGTSASRRIPIDQDLVIGRDRNINVHLDDQEVSRRHVVIQKSGQRYLLIDQNSTNGTKLNGKPVHQPAVLRHGDYIKIGNTKIRVEGESPRPKVTMRPGKSAQTISSFPADSQPQVAGPAPVSPPSQVARSVPAAPPSSAPLSPPARPASPPPPSSPAPPPASPKKPKKRRGCACLVIGLVILLVIVASLAALIWGGVISIPNIQNLFGNTTVNIGTQAPVLVENYLDSTICYVYISPAAMDNWGTNLLGEGETISPGGNYTFGVAVSDSVDMQVLDCNQALLYEQYGTPLTAEGITYTLTPPP